MTTSNAQLEAMDTEAACAYVKDGNADAPPAMHKFTYDLWPPFATESTHPMRVSRCAQTVGDGLRAAQCHAGEGWTATAVGHVRSQCQPPHSGRD